jgi:hypothetical protein
MNTPLRLVDKVHTALLRLYPSSFQETYADEMQAVFTQTAQDATERGYLAVCRILWRELFDAPIAAFRERVLNWKRREQQVGDQPSQTRLTRSEMLMALAVFLVPAGLILLNAAPSMQIERVLRPAIWILLLLGAMVGLIKRFPRWSLPYIGLVVATIVFLYLFRWEAQRIATFMASRFVSQPQNELGRLILATFWEGVVWLSLLILIAFIVLLLALLPRFRHRIRHLREDWTQFSYLLYGGAMLALVLTFEEYRYEEPYALIALLCLAAGAWGYLRSNRRFHGFLSLLAGATMAMWIAAAGIWLLVPQQSWSVWFQSHSPESERWFEAQRALIAWVWMVAILALPSLLKFLPRRHEARPTG